MCLHVNNQPEKKMGFQEYLKGKQKFIQEASFTRKHSQDFCKHTKIALKFISTVQQTIQEDANRNPYGCSRVYLSS